MKQRFYSKLGIAFFSFISLVTIAACERHTNDLHGESQDGDAVRPYVLATQGTFTGSTTNALVTASSLNSGTVGMTNGLVNDGATYWVFWGDKYLYGLRIYS